MHLSELEESMAYNVVIDRLRSPFVGAPEQAEIDSRLATAEFARELRARLDGFAAELVRSPLMSVDFNTPENPLDPPKSPRFALRNPRRAARLVVAEAVRSARVAGIVYRDLEDSSEADSELIKVLRWLLEMESLPLSERRPLKLFRELSSSATPIWMMIGGSTLGSFMNSLAERRQRPSARRGDHLWVEFLVETTAKERTNESYDWAVKFGKEGAARLGEFEGTS